MAESMAEAFFGKLSELADEFGFENEEKENFINQGMKKKGFKAVMTWTDPDDDGNNEEEPNFFEMKSKRNTRKVGENRKAGGFGMSGYGAS